MVQGFRLGLLAERRGAGRKSHSRAKPCGGRELALNERPTPNNRQQRESMMTFARIALATLGALLLQACAENEPESSESAAAGSSGADHAAGASGMAGESGSP